MIMLAVKTTTPSNSHDSLGPEDGQTIRVRINIQLPIEKARNHLQKPGTMEYAHMYDMEQRALIS